MFDLLGGLIGIPETVTIGLALGLGRWVKKKSRLDHKLFGPVLNAMIAVVAGEVASAIPGVAVDPFAVFVGTEASLNAVKAGHHGLTTVVPNVMGRRKKGSV